MYQRLTLLDNYLRQPDVPSYARTEATQIARWLKATYPNFGEIPGDLLVEKVRSGDRVGARELISEICWFIRGGDEAESGSKVDPAISAVVEPVLQCNAKTAAQRIAEIDDLAVLDALEAAEGEGKRRKTVFDAIVQRREALD